MAEPFKHPPSHLDVETPAFDGKPHIWIQWKGTDLCADVHCSCGAHSHVDADFCYFIECGECGKVWEVGTHVTLHEVSESVASEKKREGRAIKSDVSE